MEAHGWSCVLGLLCMPAGVILGSYTVSQQPSSISRLAVNSSTEITCSSSSSSDPKGFSLNRRFRGNREIVFLSLQKGSVEKTTITAEFTGRVQVTPDRQQRQDGGCGFTVRLSLLGRADTDMYYCTWSYFKSGSTVEQSSEGTVIIVREGGPQERCDHTNSEDLIFMALSVMALAVVSLLLIIALIVKCRRFKKKFRPARAAAPPRPSRPPHVCPRQTLQHCPYLITSAESLVDFRGIL